LDLSRVGLPAEPFIPDLALWDAWTPTEVVQRLAAARAPWYVTAGWALDLFHGRQTRQHEDLEVAVPRHGFAAVREALAGFELFAVGDGYAHRLDEQALATHYQTWVREPATGIWRLDVMREPWEGDTWVFRRDARVRRPASQVIARTADGIPYAEPEIALLYKAKTVREKDEADFASVLPLLDPPRRRWLAAALELVHPGHRWLDELVG